MKKYFIFAVLIFSFSSIALADQSSWDVSIGSTSNQFAYKVLRTSSTGQRDYFEEKFISIAYNYGLNKYVSAFGKVFHYQGDSNATKKYNRSKGKWEKIEAPFRYNREEERWQRGDASFETNGTFVGAGIRATTNVDYRLSAGLFISYGYLNNPDDILNSGHGQFNLGANVNLKITNNWMVFASWEHLSNGYQILSLGDKDSGFYPNNGRDFLGIGIRYTVGD